jgi:hypothetical protein
MTGTFDPARPPILFDAWVTGPSRTLKVRLAIDTGATHSLIRGSFLAGLGYDLSAATRRGGLRSVTGGARAPIIQVRQLTVLGRARTDFPVVAHDMPPAVTYDGLLGLDFFRGLVLELDFARGRVALRPPRRWWHLWR